MTDREFTNVELSSGLDEREEVAKTDDVQPFQTTISPVDRIDKIVDIAHEENFTVADRAARAIIEQSYIIPSTGAEAETTKWEKWMFMVFRGSCLQAV